MSVLPPFSESASAPTKNAIPAASHPSPAPEDAGRVSLWRSVVVLLLAALVGVAYWFNPPVNIHAQSGVVMDLPVIVGDYYGKPGEITQVERDLLPADTEFARRSYDDGRGHQINCSIVLSGAEERSIHRPEGCLTGQGWDIVGQEYIPIPLLSGHKLTARRLSLERQVKLQNNETVTVRAFYIYWFVGENVSTPSEIKRVLLSNWDRVMHNRSHRWAYVSFFSLVTDNLHPNGLNPDQTEAIMVDFAKQVVPTFQISEMPQQAKK